jgi:hypothetical protein
MPMGTSWAAGSWVDGAWVDGSWAGAGAAAPEVFGDLTTLFVAYVEALRDADLVGEDVDTLVANDLATVRAGTTIENDNNTMYCQYLSV